MSKKNCKKVYFFDLDDTLVRTTQFNEAAVKYSLEVLTKLDINISNEQAWEFYLSKYEEIKTSSNMMELYYGKLVNFYPNYFSNSSLIKKISSDGIYRYNDFFENNIKDFVAHDINKILEKLSDEGCEIGIISQGKASFQIRKFEKLEIEKYFNSNLKYYFNKKTKENYQLVIEETLEKYPG